MVTAEASQFKCSRATLLCAALQERVTELEAQVKTLESAQNHPTTKAVHTNPRSLCPTATATGMQASDLCCLGCSYILVLSDPDATTHDPDKQDSNSIYMTVSQSMPRFLDLSFPPSSLPFSDSSLYLSHQSPCILDYLLPPSSSAHPSSGVSTSISLDAGPQITDTFLETPTAI